MHKEEIYIGSNDINANLELRMSSLFRIMQEVIMHDTNDKGIGSKELMKSDILWVITRVQVEIKRLPKYEETLTAITYAGKFMQMFYPRYFRLVDKNGNTVVNLSSIWAIIDKNSRRPILKCPFQDKLFEEHFDDELPLPNKIEIKDTSLIEKRIIHYSDVDLNNHLNNTRYIELIDDIHDSLFHKEHPTTKLTLNYLKEIKENSVVEIKSNKENPEFVEVTTDGQVSFVGLIEYK